jgi:protoporphyrinogen oxidase
MAKHIGIIGGGILGMTLSLRLAERGFNVTLIEASERLGGLASPTKIGEYTWDQFYHVILLSDTNLLSLLDQLNLGEQISWNKAKTGFFTDGRLFSMSNIMEFLTFPPLGLVDKLRLGFNIFYASKVKTWGKLEKVLVADWLTRLSGNRTFNKIWLPLLKCKLGDNYRLANAAFIWSIISRMYAARRSGLKQEMFGYVNGGYTTILNKFQDELDHVGVKTLCNSIVKEVHCHDGRARVEMGEGERKDFDKLILTIPCHQISAICPRLTQSESQRLNEVQYQGVICPALILKKPISDYYITNITDDWVPFTGVIEMTALVDRKYFDGHSLVYLPRYLGQTDPFWEKNDGDIREEFLNALMKMYPSFKKEDVLAFKVTRASDVFPITTLNYSTELLPSTKTSLKHVYIVNSAQIPNATMNVNEIVGLANRKSIEISNLVGS